MTWLLTEPSSPVTPPAPYQISLIAVYHFPPTETLGEAISEGCHSQCTLACGPPTELRVSLSSPQRKRGSTSVESRLRGLSPEGTRPQGGNDVGFDAAKRGFCGRNGT